MPERAAATHGRWRLLPQTTHLGFTPYIWLLYLSIFLVEPVDMLLAGRLGVVQALGVLLALVIFLASYFRGYWVAGRELMVVIAVQSALGVALAPLTVGSSVFFVYAASFAGNLDRAKVAFRTIALVAVAAAITFWLVGATPWYGVPAVLMPMVIGFINYHYAEGRRTNARLHLAQEQIVHLAAVAERERIARDLHDLLGHTLSLIVLKAELAGKLLERDPARAAQEVRDVESVSRSALRNVREAVRGYRASLSDEADRSRALLEAAAIRADVNVERPISLGRPREEALALALREAVTNVVRHSAARECRVALRADERGYLLEIADDGSGRLSPEGTGLRAMRERIESLGGTVTRSRGLRGGARLAVRLPLGSPEGDAAGLSAQVVTPRAAISPAEASR